MFDVGRSKRSFRLVGPPSALGSSVAEAAMEDTSSVAEAAMADTLFRAETEYPCLDSRSRGIPILVVQRVDLRATL
jgi:hypothetical protein